MWKFWSSGSYAVNEAAKDVSLRMIDPFTISLIDETSGEVLDTVEYSRAFFEVFDGAVVLHRGRQLLVRKLDVSSRAALARPVRVDYYTSALNETQINVVRRVDVDGVFRYGIVQVVAKVKGFCKRKLGSGEIFEEGVCSLPPLEYETTALWVDLPASLRRELSDAGLCPLEAVHACNHILASVCPLFSQCDPSDLSTEHLVATSASTEEQRFRFRVLVFDKRPGGLGACAALYTFREKVMRCALDTLRECACINGCPCCILEKR